MEDFIWRLVIIGLITMVLVFAAVSMSWKRVEKLRRYWDVQIGMSEHQMLDIMGGGYSRSLLKNNRTKCEWRINGSSYGSSEPIQV